jgi:hypothetical protein
MLTLDLIIAVVYPEISYSFFPVTELVKDVRAKLMPSETLGLIGVNTNDLM